MGTAHWGLHISGELQTASNGSHMVLKTESRAGGFQSNVETGESQLDWELSAESAELKTKGNLPTALRNREKDGELNGFTQYHTCVSHPQLPSEVCFKAQHCHLIC